MSENNTKQPIVEEISNEEIQKVLEKYDSDAKVRKLHNKSIVFVISFMGVMFSLLHIYATFNPIPTLMMRSIHLMFALGLVFLIYPTFKNQNRTKIPIYDWIFFALSLSSFIYLFVEYDNLMTSRGGIPNTMDIVMAFMVMAMDSN